MIKYYCVLLSFLLLSSWGNALAQKTESSPLSLTITFGKVATSKRAFSVIAKIVNDGDQSIVVDKNSVGYETAFTTENGVFSRRGEQANGYKGTYIILSPGKSFIDTREIELNDDFFESGREYKLKIMYGQFMDETFQGRTVWRGIVESNAIEFYLRGNRVVPRVRTTFSK